MAHDGAQPGTGAVLRMGNTRELFGDFAAQEMTTHHHHMLPPFHPKPTGQGQGLRLRACLAATSSTLPSALMSEHFCPSQVYKKKEQVGAGRAEQCQEGDLSTPPAFQE